MHRVDDRFTLRRMHQAQETNFRKCCDDGSPLIKAWGTNQIATAVPSGGAEYCSLAICAGMAPCIKQIRVDLGVELDKSIESKSDATVEIGVVKRIGLGKVRHNEVTQPWAQEKASKGDISVAKVRTRRRSLCQKKS